MATPVTITTSAVNQYSTIMRACLTAMNACAKLGDIDQMKDFQLLHYWASTEHEEALRNMCTAE